jgi:hypothetical protein
VLLLVLARRGVLVGGQGDVDDRRSALRGALEVNDQLGHDGSPEVKVGEWADSTRTDLGGEGSQEGQFAGCSAVPLALP